MASNLKKPFKILTQTINNFSMIKFDTQASGKFSVYKSDGTLIAEATNMIVDLGLNAVATNTWASLLKHCLGGTSSTVPPSSSDIAIEGLAIVSEQYGAGSAGNNGSPAMPTCYTLTDWDPTANSMTYRIGKSFELRNRTANPITISELGVQSNARIYAPNGAPGRTGLGDATLTDPYDLFSRAWVSTPFILKPDTGSGSPDSFVYVIYELRLLTGNSTGRQTFQVATDLSSSFQFPLSTNLGLFACPYAYLDSTGNVKNNTLSAGEGFFEPSNTQYYLYKLTTNPAGGGDTYFDLKRDKFEDGATALDLNNGVTTTGVTFANVHSVTNAYKFKNEDLGTYIEDSFRRARHIIVPPETPSINQNLYGFTISTRSAVATTLQQNGYHIVFPTASAPWVKPPNGFMKFYLEQTWSWTP